MNKTTLICMTICFVACYVAAAVLAGFLCWYFKNGWGVLVLLLTPKVTDNND